MYYSLTFNIGGVKKNTWADWRLIPDTPPSIPPPEPNLNYVDIPGRDGGPLDLTGVPFNKLTYKRITGSWNFLFEPEDRHSRINLYEELMRTFVGKVGTVKLEEDLTHYYRGRFSVSPPKTGNGPCRITIAYDLEPRRWMASSDALDTTYAPTAL
jgi:hypothetical protein